MLDQNTNDPILHQKEFEKESFLQMLLHLFKVAIPSIMTMVMTLFIEIVNLLFIGHLNDSAKIAGIGLATIYVNFVCQSIIIGLNGGIGILVAQAYGAKNMRKCGIYLNRGRAVILIAFIPMCFIMINCKHVLLFIRQDAQTAQHAQTFTNFLMPAMLFYSQFDATRQYLNSIHKSALVALTLITTSLLHLFWCFFFVQILKYDLQGIGLATIISHAFNFIMITIFCMVMEDQKESFFFFTSDTFQKIGDYVIIGMQQAMMVCLEWGSIFIISIIASFISIDAQAAQIIAFNSFLILMMIPFGGQIGTTACVAKSMGEGNAKKARIYIKVATVIFLILDFFFAFVIITEKNYLSKAFTFNDYSLLINFHNIFFKLSSLKTYQHYQIVNENIPTINHIHNKSRQQFQFYHQNKVIQNFFFISLFFRAIISSKFDFFFLSYYQVVPYVNDTFNALAMLLIFQGVQFIEAGGLRGLGLHAQTSLIILFAQYCGSIPFAYLFAIVLDYKVKGIRYGIIYKYFLIKFPKLLSFLPSYIYYDFEKKIFLILVYKTVRIKQKSVQILIKFKIRLSLKYIFLKLIIAGTTIQIILYYYVLAFRVNWEKKALTLQQLFLIINYRIL